jgi:hypothetical protein
VAEPIPGNDPPPPFYGGQGRTAREVRRDGSALAFTLMLAAVVAIIMVARLLR